jgi:hypothetical protein
MKTKLLNTAYCCCLLLLFGTGCKKDDENENTKNPPYAATTQTWTFGNQTWSDAIQMPDCNKEDFEDSYTDPQCRSYTENGKTWYYYNWPYVNANKTTMCPDPWRVPTKEDFDVLVSNTTSSTLIDAWGYGGGARGSSMYDVNSYADYWSSTVDSDNTNYAYFSYYTIGSLYVTYDNKYHGFQVRCVKDN